MNVKIEEHSVDELYYEACKALLWKNTAVKVDRSYPKEHKLYSELNNVSLVLKNPYDHIINIPDRDLSLRYLFGEFAFYMKGSNKLKDINKYSKFWNKISDNNKTVSSGYGHKLFTLKNKGVSQWDHAFYHLKKNKSTKRATMLINTPMNTVYETRDTPCTMYLHFNIIDNCLNMTTHMRSNDIFFGVPYDISFFTMLQEYMLVNLNMSGFYTGIKMGIYTHFVNSLHLYSKDLDVIDKITESNSAFIQKPCPAMTNRTVIEMEDFIRMESNKRPKHGISDMFLIYAMNVIKGGNPWI